MLIKFFFAACLVILLANNDAFSQSGYSFSEVIELGDTLVKQGNLDDAEKLYRAELLKQPKIYSGDLYLNIGIVNYYKENYDSSVSAYNKAAVYAENVNKLSLAASAYNNIGNIYKKLGDFDKAILNYTAALIIYKRKKDTVNIGVTSYNIGLSYKELALYDKSSESFYNALNIFNLLHQEDNLAKAYQSLGNIFRIQKDYSNSLNYHNKALKIKRKKNKADEIAASLNDIGNTFKELQDYDKAIQNYLEAINISDESDRGTLLDNIGEVKLLEGNLEEAESYFKQSLSIHEKSQNRKGIALTLYELGELFFQRGEFSIAEQYLNRSSLLCAEFDYRDVLLKNYQIQQRVFEATKRYFLANEIGKAYLKLEKDLFNERKTIVISGLNIIHRTDEMEKALILLNKDNKFKETLIQQQAFEKKVILVLFFLSVVIISIGVFAIRSNRKLIRLEKSRSLFEEKLRLDTQHRTKNFLQVILSLTQFTKRQMELETDKQLVINLQKNISAMTLINDSLGINSHLVEMSSDFSWFLERHIDILLKSMKNSTQEITTFINLQPLILNPKRAYPLALIVNEIITNAIKYGLNDEACLAVNLITDKNDFEIEIRDNGSGLPDDFNYLETDSTGYHLIHVFIKQLKGSFNFRNDNGLVVTIRGAIN